MNNSPPYPDHLDDTPTSFVDWLRRNDLQRIVAIPHCREITDLEELRRFANEQSNYFSIEKLSDLEFHRLLKALGRTDPPSPSSGS